MLNLSLRIREKDYSACSVLVIGGGWMAQQYCQALFMMGIRRVTVISRSVHSGENCCRDYGFTPLSDGYRERLPELGGFDLVIIATPVHELMPAALAATENGSSNILVEKPGSLYSQELKEWRRTFEEMPVRLRIAFNRLAYPNLWALQTLIAAEGGITSCRYTFTERIHTINFDKNEPDCYARLGISNSLHVIAMAHFLIGLPRELSCHHGGGFPWHPSGSCFVGSGISETNIPFSYHADWNSAGRWGIEIMTPHNAYRLIPLEELSACQKGSFAWEKVTFEVAYPGAKQGVAEQIALMLDQQLEIEYPLPNLEQTQRYLELAERICNYASCRMPS